MTQPTAAPPAPPAQPAVAPPEPREAEPRGGPSWRGASRRLRAEATTEPGRLRLIGAVLAALLVVFGAITAVQISERTSAAGDVMERSQPLSADAAKIYRSLADADTSASSGFLAGGDEPRSVRARYEKDIQEASELLAGAASSSDGSRPADRQIEVLNKGLPVYTGLVESARANNRQGLPLGGAYLRYANEKMRGELLPAAETLYKAETAELGRDYDAAKGWPWAAVGLGVVTLLALVWAQRRNYRRTNRVFNPGLLSATAAAVVLLLWLGVGHTLARSNLTDSDEQGARSLQALNEVWIGSLQARGDENMTLVARGAGAEYEKSYKKQMRGLFGGPDSPGGLQRAQALADDSTGRQSVRNATNSLKRWQERHANARAKDDDGAYDDAVEMVIGKENSTGEAFDRVDRNLAKASAHEQQQFEEAADRGRGWLGGLGIGAVVLAVLGAAAVVWGQMRRLAEYR